MTERSDEETLYECECFRILRFVDDDGESSISISFFDHGIDLYLSEDEFGHFAEAIAGLQTIPAGTFHH